VVTIDPHDVKTAMKTVKEAIHSDEAWLIISKQPCPLRTKIPLGPPRRLDAEACKECGLCLKLGCPAIEGRDAKPVAVNGLICSGCGLCDRICPTGAFVVEGSES
jgi:indolepyruvate ferredoxin oxidoreductase alpha subunit